MNQEITRAAGRTLYVQHFDSVIEYVEFARASCTPTNKERFDFRMNKDADLGSIEARLKWYGVDSLHTVERMVRDGWQEGTQRVLDAMNKFSGEFQAVSMKRRLVRGDRGDELDVHRVMRGELDKAWSRRERSSGRKSSVVTLACDLMMPSKRKPDELFWRGAAVTRLCDILTDAGYAVEVVGYIRSDDLAQHGEVDIQQTIVVKQSDMPLDMNALSSVICLAGFFRHFGLLSRTSINSKLNSYFGASNYDAALVYPSAHLIRASGGQITTQAHAEAWLAGRLAEFEARHAEAA